MFNKIIQKTKLNEAKAKLNFLKIALAIKCLHFKKICHRILKPKNVQLCLANESLAIITDKVGKEEK